MIIECQFVEPHEHELPDDWFLGGADKNDPRADARFKPSVYEYYNDKVQIIWTTTVPFCDMEALDYFTKIASWGPKYNPVWISVKRPGEKVTMLPWTYNKETDEVVEK